MADNEGVELVGVLAFIGLLIGGGVAFYTFIEFARWVLSLA